MRIQSAERIQSDYAPVNPIFQRHLFAYEYIAPKVRSKTVLEVAFGEGYGAYLLSRYAKSVVGLEASERAIAKAKKKFHAPNIQFKKQYVPPIPFPENSFDVIVAFQFIEHIKEPEAFLKEAYRVLKPQGTLYITTPNALQSPSYNPYHVKEYTFEEMEALVKKVFKKYRFYGIYGDETFQKYFMNNKGWVKDFLRKVDPLSLHRKVPQVLLRPFYDVAVSWMRWRLYKQHPEACQAITTKNFYMDKPSPQALDIFVEMEK